MVYVATFPEAVYVLHVFEKKTRKTSPRDLALGRQRYPIDDSRKADLMKKRRCTAREISTTGSAFFDSVEPAEAERLSIQSGLALALEREIAVRKWTQAEAARRIGITQPRVSYLRRGRLDKFSIDALIVCTLSGSACTCESIPRRHRSADVGPRRTPEGDCGRA